MSLFRGMARLPFTARIERRSSFNCILPARLHCLSQEGGLFGLPLRASNEHLPSVRVPRAQEAHSILPFFPTFPLGIARLSFTARIERAQFHPARSASKKDGLAAPLPP